MLPAATSCHHLRAGYPRRRRTRYFQADGSALRGRPRQAHPHRGAARGPPKPLALISVAKPARGREGLGDVLSTPGPWGTTPPAQAWVVPLVTTRPLTIRRLRVSTLSPPSASGDNSSLRCQVPFDLLFCSPNGIRTRVATLRGWCPRPLDDGAVTGAARYPVGSGGRTRTPNDRTRTCCVTDYTTPERVGPA